MKKTIRLPFNERQPGDRFETRSGLPVRILCEDLKAEKPIVVAIRKTDGTELLCLTNPNGTKHDHEEFSFDIFAVRETEAPDFDLEAAQAGAPVKTKSGLRARIVCFDRRRDDYPLVVLVDEGCGEYTYHHALDGKFTLGMDSDEDLIMA